MDVLFHMFVYEILFEFFVLILPKKECHYFGNRSFAKRKIKMEPFHCIAEETQKFFAQLIFLQKVLQL